MHARAETVAVLGAGTMGQAIWLPLLRAGYKVSAYSRSPRRLPTNLPPGLTVFSSALEAARASGCVLSFVSDDEASEAVWEGVDGALQACEPDMVVIESSTLSVDRVRAWSAAARGLQLHPVAAPVTGGPARASEGGLIVFAGGSNEAMARAAGVLEAVGAEVVRFPSPAHASGYKLVHNAAAGIALAGLAEAMALATILDLPPALTLDCLSRWGWASLVAQSEGPKMLSGDHSLVTFALANFAKDLRYAARVDESHQLPLVDAAASVLHEAAAQEGLGRLNMSALRTWYV